MPAVSTALTAPQSAAVGAAAADHRAHATALRWAARCQDMEAVLDDLGVALLPRPEITHLVGNTCEGIDCRFDKGFSPTDYDIFPHLHFDAVLVRRADGTLVLTDESAVPAGVSTADLEEDHEGIHPDSLGWQACAPYRTAPPAGFDAADDEVWLDAAALRARVFALLAPTIDGPVSGGRTADARTAARDAQLDALALGVRDECFSREDIIAIGYGHCEEEGCFEPGEDAYPHLHPETVLVRHQDGVLVGYIPTGVPDEVLADDADWAVPDLYRTIPLDAHGPWIDPDVDIWLDARALCARADHLH